MTEKKPAPVIRHRVRDEYVYKNLLAQGMDSFLADLVSRRIESTVSKEDCIVGPSLNKLKDPSCIPDMSKAVDRIVQAIINSENVVFCVDHDMDGQASAAVLWSAFVQYFGVPKERLTVVTSHRLVEGYGITAAVVDRILKCDATLVISADKGSSDEAGINRIAAAGKDVVVTDHHELPVEGPPKSALACVNPTRDDSKYDPYICGAGVAWLTMALVRTELLGRGFLPEIPSMAGLLDYVAVATVADCVSLRPDLSYSNRAFVKCGLSLINAGSRPCWQVFCQDFSGTTVTSQAIGFQLAPAIAAAGRLDWAESGFRFLVSEDCTEARKYWGVLKRENELRKSVERELRMRAFEAAAELETTSLVLYFEDGHAGVHGITASRLVERFGKPAAIFAPKGAGSRNSHDPVTDRDGRTLASGSFRSVPGLHVRDALQNVADCNPGLIVSFGGHAGAGGATIAIDDFNLFASAYETAVCEQLKTLELKPEVWVDGGLEGSMLSMQTFDMLGRLEPWGRDFSPPLFCNDFYVLSVNPIGDGTHLKCALERQGEQFSAIWFNASEPEVDLPIKPQQSVTLVYQLGANEFRGQRKFQLQIVLMA